MDDDTGSSPPSAICSRRHAGSRSRRLPSVPATAPAAASAIKRRVLRQGPIPRFVHGLIEYVAGVVFIGAPFVLVFESAAATAVSIVLGVVVLAVAAASSGPTSIINQIPLSVHVVLDYILAVVLIAAPFLFGFADETAPLAFFIVLGVGHLLITIGTRFSADGGTPGR